MPDFVEINSKGDNKRRALSSQIDAFALNLLAKSRHNACALPLYDISRFQWKKVNHYGASATPMERRRWPRPS